jgi:hypothetical protein
LPVDFLAGVSEVVLEVEATPWGLIVAAYPQESFWDIMEVAASSRGGLQDGLHVHYGGQGGLIHHAGAADRFRRFDCLRVFLIETRYQLRQLDKRVNSSRVDEDSSARSQSHKLLSRPALKLYLFISSSFACLAFSLRPLARVDRLKKQTYF